jgi:hypothetical protein
VPVCYRGGVSDPTRPPHTVDPVAANSQAPTSSPPVDEKTQPFRLRDLAPRLAQRRRRTTAAELTFRRQRADARVPLDRSETTIGRDAGCDIVLSEKSASLRHARIIRTAGGYFELQDLDSTNGIMMDGERIERLTLQDGDTFIIGETRFSILIAAVVGGDG